MPTRKLLLFVFILILCCAWQKTVLAITHVKYASIVLDYRTGKVLHSINANAQRFPASLTKMMTLFMVFEALESGKITQNTRFYISPRAASREPSKLGLRAGESIAVRDIILGLVTRSANDAATVIAEGLGGGSEKRFSHMMTERAHQLGLTNTYFCNASGLPAPCQVSTASDLAHLARLLIMKYPQYYNYFKVRQFTYRGNIYTNHNHMLGWYEGMDGIKTGYCRASGFNIATSAKRGNQRLVGVVMGLPSVPARDNLMARLLDNSFSMAPYYAMRSIERRG